MSPRKPKFKFLTIDDVLAMEPPEWLIEDVLPRDALVLMYGQPASYKTFIGLDMAFRIASGMSWHGKETKKAGVLYISPESPAGLRNRIEAWEAHNEVSIPREGVIIVTDAVQLHQAQESKDFVKELLAHLEKRRES